MVETGDGGWEGGEERVAGEVEVDEGWGEVQD